MCVIMLVEKLRPTPYMVERAWQRNDDGGGVAYREEGKDGPEVVWRKGMEGEDGLAEMQELVKTLPTPFIAHFRVASCGGVRPSLTHPFPIQKNASLALSGRTKGYVLFHNGDWKGWADAAREAAIKSGTQIPIGRWSDTRAIAFLSAIYGPGFMEFLPDQKGVVFGPKDYDIHTGNGWKKVNDVWCSNDYYMTSTRVQHGMQAPTFCRFPRCLEKAPLDEYGYCKNHKGGVQSLHPHSGSSSSSSSSSAPTLVEQAERAEKKDVYMEAVKAGVQGARNESTSGSGGTQAVIPFLPTQDAQGQIVSLATVVTLSEMVDGSGKRVLSKNLLKRVRGLYSQMFESKNPRKQLSARKQLEGITKDLKTKHCSSGQAH